MALLILRPFYLWRPAFPGAGAGVYLLHILHIRKFAKKLTTENRPTHSLTAWPLRRQRVVGPALPGFTIGGRVLQPMSTESHQTAWDRLPADGPRLASSYNVPRTSPGHKRRLYYILCPGSILVCSARASTARRPRDSAVSWPLLALIRTILSCCHAHHLITVTTVTTFALTYHLSHHCNCITPSATSPDLKLICFTNPFPFVFLVPFGLLSRILDVWGGSATPKTIWFARWRQCAIIYRLSVER